MKYIVKSIYCALILNTTVLRVCVCACVRVLSKFVVAINAASMLLLLLLLLSSFIG